jgi:hypothetical protein
MKYVLIVLLLSGCATLEEKMQQLQCSAPVDSTMCIGWQS